MMERQSTYVITEELEAEFRISIEGCIPDLMEAAGPPAHATLEVEDGCLVPVQPDPNEGMHDNIYDYAADRAYDTFPNVPHEERTAMAKRIATYYCGQPDPDQTFKVADLATRGDA